MAKPKDDSKLSKYLSPSLVPPSWENAVRTVTMDECAEAGRSLAYSFATDAMSRYVLDGDDMAGFTAEQKWDLHVHIMTYMVAFHIYKGAVTTIGSDYDCVALWITPGNHSEDWWSLFRSGLWKLWFQLSPEGWRRYCDEMGLYLDQAKEEVMGERDSQCYYLAYIGTKPSARGKGYAGKLIRDMIAKADAENRPIYLESSHEGNNPFYAKFGFKVKRDVVFERSPGQIRMFCMVREPQVVKASCNIGMPDARSPGIYC